MLGVRDSRISLGVRQIGNEIHENEDNGQEENGSIDRRQIASGNGVHDVSPDSRPRKDRLGKNRTGEIVPEVETEHGDNRDQRITKRVSSNDDALAQSLFAGGSDEIAAKYLEHRRAGDASEERNRSRAKSKRRKNQVLDATVARWRQPLQCHRENQNQDQPHPIDRE